MLDHNAQHMAQNDRRVETLEPEGEIVWQLVKLVRAHLEVGDCVVVRPFEPVNSSAIFPIAVCTQISKFIVSFNRSRYSRRTFASGMVVCICQARAC